MKRTMEEAAEMIARVDWEINGGFYNGPYTVAHPETGEAHKVHVREITHKDGSASTYLEIIRPATVVSNKPLWVKPAPEQTNYGKCKTAPEPAHMAEEQAF